MPLESFGLEDPAALDAAVRELTHESPGWTTPQAGPDGPCEWTTCASVNRVPGAGAAMRRTRNGKPVSSIIGFDDDEWAAFVQAVKDGQFD